MIFGDKDTAGVNDNGDKHKVAIISTIFRKNWKHSQWDT
jgi:hypothetical protein